MNQLEKKNDVLTQNIKTKESELNKAIEEKKKIEKNYIVACHIIQSQPKFLSQKYNETISSLEKAFM